MDLGVLKFHKNKQKIIQMQADKTDTENVQQSEYFESILTSMKNPNISIMKGKIFNDSITDKLEDEILSSTIIMPEDLGSHRLKLQDLKKEEPKKLSESELLRNVEIQKMQTIQRMRELTKQQLSLKINIRSKSQKEKDFFKSSLTQEDKIQMKGLIQSYKMYERALKQKDKEIQKQDLEKSLDKIRSIQQKNEERRNQRRQIVLNNMKSMQLKSQQRKKSDQIAKFKIEQINSKQYLYEQYLEKEKQCKNQKLKQYERALDEVKRKAKLDTRQISEHQRKYQRTLDEVRQKSSKSLLHNSRHRIKSYNDNYYRSMTRKKLEQQKIQQLQRIQKGFNMHEKISKFQEEIRTKFKPKVSQKSKFQLPKQTSASAKVLTNVEQRLKGVQYLQIAKKLKDIEKEKEKERRRTHAVPIGKIQYKDYSKQLKYHHNQTAENQFKGIFRDNKSMDNYETASKALELAQKIQAKSKKRKDEKLVNSVKNKLKILEALE